MSDDFSLRMHRRDAIRQLGGGLLAIMTAGCGRAFERSADRRPNILFIMTDDHAQSALGSYGNTVISTPNLDRIGAEGVRFTEAFVTNSLCIPSRASYLSGLYSHTHGILTNGAESSIHGEPPLDNATTWPVLLQRAGYYAGVVGKWHVNNPPEGYDDTAILQGQGMYFDPVMLIGGEKVPQSGHTDDVIGDHALAFLRKRPADRPFCLLYQFKAPHRHWEPAPRFRDKFADTEIPPPPTFFEDLEKRPGPVRKTDLLIADMWDYRDRGVSADMPFEQRARLNFQHFIKDYYRVLLGVDENVGRVLDELERQGIARNTLVIYTSDNGFFLGEHGMFDKRLMYEPSIRVPMLVRYPAAVAGGQVNREHMLLNIDLAPSLLDVAGESPPATMQGESYKPILLGRETDWRKDFLYEYYEFPSEHCVRRHRGVRDRRFKLIHWEVPEAWELYDLANDPRETTNLAGLPQYRAEEGRLRERLAALRRRYDDVDPPGYAPAEPRDLKMCR